MSCVVSVMSVCVPCVVILGISATRASRGDTATEGVGKRSLVHRSSAEARCGVSIGTDNSKQGVRCAFPRRVGRRNPSNRRAKLIHWSRSKTNPLVPAESTTMLCNNWSPRTLAANWMLCSNPGRKTDFYGVHRFIVANKGRQSGAL